MLRLKEFLPVLAPLISKFNILLVPAVCSTMMWPESTSCIHKMANAGSKAKVLSMDGVRISACFPSPLVLVQRDRVLCMPRLSKIPSLLYAT